MGGILIAPSDAVLTMRRTSAAYAACLTLVLCGIMGIAPCLSANSKSSGQTLATDGRHDFDWEFGTWKTHVKRRLRPLSGSQEWVEYEGTTTVSKVWNGQANLVELDVTGPAGRIEALSLRLYNPEARQWSLNFSNINSGTMAIPTVGEFKDGRGEFYAQETLGARSILVRFVISDFSRESAHFEQSFSDDGGKTWETNWIAVDTRLK
jgi:hypothetical protein